MRTWLLQLGCVCLIGSAYAQESTPPPAANVRQACQADIQKLCPGVEPGGGRIRECIKEHRSELSAGCQSAIAAQHAHHAAAKGNGSNPPPDAPPPSSKPQ